MKQRLRYGGIIIMLLIGIALILTAMVWTGWLRRGEKAAELAAKAAAEAAVAKTGLEASGNVLGSFTLRGYIQGVGIGLANGTFVLPPGAQPNTGVPHTYACKVRVDAPLADQLVCRADEVQKIMGPLPTARRVRTGHSAFDRRYSIFMGLPRENSGGGYRDTAGGSEIPWAQGPVLDALMALELQWLWVQQERVEVVYPALDIANVGPAAQAAAALVLASAGKPIPALERARPTAATRPPSPTPSSLAWWGLLPGALGGAVLVTISVGLYIVCLAAPVLALLAIISVKRWQRARTAKLLQSVS